MSVLALVEKLFPFSYSITGRGNDGAITQYLDELNFTVHEYASGQSLNGWFIPHAWQVNKACIYQKGELIYDAKSSPLGVASLSPSFSGELSLAELQTHLSSSETLPDAVLYQWQNLYRPKEITWGISIPHKHRSQLADMSYQVDIDTELTPSTMKVLDYLLPGDSDETLVINGHNCHPFQANDDISGCAVAIRVIQALKKSSLSKPLKYSYRVVIAPELHGPMFWLNEMSKEQQSLLKGCILLKSVGNAAAMRLQRSYLGEQVIDQAAQSAFKHRYDKFEQGEFRSIYGNDETVFEAPPYNIPTISLTRWPFNEYHSDLDTPETLSEQHLQDTVDLVLDIIERYENLVQASVKQQVPEKVAITIKDKPNKHTKFNQSYKINFQGLVCLSAFGLYKSIPPVSKTGVDYNSLHGRWNKLMNCLPRELDNNMTIDSLAKKYQLPRDEIQQYLQQWLAHGLLTIEQ